MNVCTTPTFRGNIADMHISGLPQRSSLGVYNTNTIPGPMLWVGSVGAEGYVRGGRDRIESCETASTGRPWWEGLEDGCACINP